MSELKIGRMVLGVCQTNCYFLYRSGSAEAIVVDPADQGDKIASALKRNGFQVAGILLTHGHFDHILGCEAVKMAANKDAEECGTEACNAEPVKVYAAEPEKEMLADAHLNLSKQMRRPYTMQADVYVDDGDEITIAGITCKVITTPGHTPGGCCYYFEEAGLLVAGDTLFLESVGRTDFPGGSASALVRSVKEKLFLLPDETIVYPGHGDSTSIGHEKKYNPFCA